MVNEDDIRLSDNGENDLGNTPERHENDRGNAPANDGGNLPEAPAENNDPGGNIPAENNDSAGNVPAEPAGNGGSGNGGSSGRDVKPAELDKPAEGLDDFQPEDGENKEDQPGEDIKDIPGKINKEIKNDGEAGTEQPWGISLDLGNGWLLGGLALVAVLAVCTVLEMLRRNKHRSGRKTRPAAAAYVSGGSVAVADYQDIGAREDQQDSFDYSAPELYAQQGVMAVVADGMGGLANGKAVSNALVRTFVDGFPQVSGYYNQTADILLDLSIRANARINQMLRGAERSGSTLVAALVRDGYLHYLTVGDSRIYLYRGGALLQLNREHIYQEELAVQAVNQAVAMAQVRGDRQAHSLTSYFGIGRIPAIDRNDEGIRLVPGDRILLASDGVFGTLSQDEMEQALQSGIQDAANQMGSMIRSAGKPYQDNNTLVILEYRG